MRRLDTLQEWGEKLIRQHRPADLLALTAFMKPRPPVKAAAPAVAAAPPAPATTHDTAPVQAPPPSLVHRRACQKADLRSLRHQDCLCSGHVLPEPSPALWRVGLLPGASSAVLNPWYKAGIVPGLATLPPSGLGTTGSVGSVQPAPGAPTGRMNEPGFMRRRMLRPTGAIVNARHSRASCPPGAATRSITKFPSSAIIAIFISSKAR